jgi:hypothetical protein
MSERLRWPVVAALLLAIGLAWLLPRAGASADGPVTDRMLTGAVHDRQSQLVEGAQISLRARGDEGLLAEATTQADGRYALSLPLQLPDELVLHVERTHFEETQIELQTATLRGLESGEVVVLPDTVLARSVGPAFWVATLIFAGVLALIATGVLHNTLAALTGATVVLAVSYFSHVAYEDLFIFDFGRALRYVDWNVIFLIMG